MEDAARLISRVKKQNWLSGERSGNRNMFKEFKALWRQIQVIELERPEHLQSLKDEGFR